MKIKYKKEKTDRGFTIVEFTDGNDTHCSLQKSSVATEDMIWLGRDEIDPKELIPGEGWISTRMHLTQNQVKALLPFLIKFVKTGDI
jgi:hypothetical protein